MKKLETKLKKAEWYDKYIGKKFVGDAGKVVTFEGVFHEQKYDAKQNRVYETGRLQYSFYYIEDDASDYVAYKEARAIFKRPWKGGTTMSIKKVKGLW